LVKVDTERARKTMTTAIDLKQVAPAADAELAIEPRQRLCALCCYALLIFSIALFAGIRFHLRHTPLERDAGEYAYMGQLMLDGIPPYKLAANMKLPGTYAAYAAIMAVFGQTAAGIHMGVIVVTSLSAIFLFLIGRRLYGLLAGSVAAASFISFSARPGVLGIDGQATHFVNVMALAGILLLLYAIPLRNAGSGELQNSHRRSGTLLLFVAGLCFGLSFLMKQPGILFGMFAGIYWLYCERKLPKRQLLIGAGALILGTLLPYAITCLLLLRAGVFHNFWFWTWTYAGQYAGLTPLHEGLRYLKMFMNWAVRPFALWAFALVGLLSPIWSRRARAHAGFLAGFLVTAFLAVCPGLYFRPHYWIVLLPAGALAIGVAIDSLREVLLESRFRRFALVPLLIFVLIYATSVRGQWKAFYRLDPVTLSLKMYDPGQDFPLDVQIADFIKARAHVGDEVAVLGSEPEICFYTHLRCATSYIYVYPLMEPQSFAKQMQAQMKRELDSAPPRFLVYVDNSWSWGWKPTLEENQAFLDWTWQFAHSGYKLVHQLPVVDDGKDTESLFSDRACFYIFERTTN
jgi:hypothetical protein